MSRSPIRALTDDEEAEIQEAIASDPDSPELTDEQMALARPFAEVFPALANAIKRARGRPKVISPKEAVTLRLPPEIVARYKRAGGDNWRGLMSAQLGFGPPEAEGPTRVSTLAGKPIGAATAKKVSLDKRA